MSNGKFIWFDYMANDTHKALAFYSEAVGWKTQTIHMADGPYNMLLVKEAPFGGVVNLPEGASKGGATPYWLAYISTDDVDGVAVKAGELGGAVLKAPFNISGIGRVAIIKDPQGAIFAAFHPERNQTPPAADLEGTMVWSELATSDPAAAISFYQALFGWAKTGEIEMGEAGKYSMFGEGKNSVGGIFAKPTQMPVSAWVYYANTFDLEAATARIKQHGGKVLNGPKDVPGGRISQFTDPQGGAFALHQAAAS